MTTSSRSSDLKSASAQIVLGTGRINAISMLGDGVNASSILVYDTNTGTATGKVLAKAACKAADQQNHIIFTNPIYAELGIYVSLSGTGGNYIIYHGG